MKKDFTVPKEEIGGEILQKQEMRKQYLRLRDNLRLTDIRDKSKKIIEKLYAMPCYRQAKTVMMYIDFRNEVSTKAVLLKALHQGKKVVVPVTDTRARKLILSEIKDADRELRPGSYGILEPAKEFIREVSADILDIIIVPGLVFDLRGYRIGYGGGYYDKLLQDINPNTKTIGLAFDFQIVDSLCIENFDRKVDVIITEERIISYEHAG